jgi:predicted metal-dependent enzyme (double-stranded beta helix superfamily)
MLDALVAELRAIWAAAGDVGARMQAARQVLERAVADPRLRDASRSWPSTEPRKNLLFYEDPDFGFALNGVVRSPGYRGGVHDHAHAWVLYGVIDGTETLERFDRVDDGSRDGFAELVRSSATVGTPGRVDLVPAYGIHAERGGPTRSAALILRSERVAGRVLQHAYDLEHRTVVKRDGPVQIPYPLTPTTVR